MYSVRGVEADFTVIRASTVSADQELLDLIFGDNMVFEFATFELKLISEIRLDAR